MSVGLVTSRTRDGVVEPTVRTGEPGSDRLGVSTDAFVGREHELQVLQARIDEAILGRGGLLLVSGEPGIGKTRILTEAARYAESTGMLALWGRCWEGEGAPAFWPWRQIIRSCIAGAAERGPELVARGEEVLRSLTSNELLTVERIDTDAQFRLFDAISDVLRSVIAARPMLLLLDDLHQADASSVRVLEFYLNEIAHARCLVVASARELEPRPQVSVVLNRLARDPFARSLRLAGLNGREARTLISSHLAGMPISDTHVERIERRTEGNPFFLIEVCRTIKLSGGIEGSAVLDVPASLKNLLDQRLADIGPAGRALLRTAAVIGRSFSKALLDRLCGPANPTEGHLRLAEEKGLIRTVLTGPGEFQFAHALIREAFYGELSPEDRATVHGRVADAIAATPGIGPDSCADTLAHHYFAAGHHAPGGKAIECTLRAAAQARSTAAYDYAAELLQRALTLPEVADDRDLKTDILLQLGGALLAAGRWFESREVFVEASGVARAAGSPGRFAAAAIGVKGLILAPAPPDASSIDLLVEALKELPPDAVGVRVRVLHALATATHFCPPSQSRAELATEALMLAESIGRNDAVAAALEALIVTHWRPGTPDTALAHAERLLRLGKDAGDEELQGKARIHLYVARTQRADTTAESDLDVAERIALRENHPKLRWLVDLLRSSSALAKGQFDTGLEYARSARELGKKCHDQTAFLHLGLNLLLRARLRGTIDDGESSFIRAGAKLTPDVPLSMLALYCTDYAFEPGAPRQRALDETMAVCADYLESNAFSLWAQCLLAELAFLTGNRTVAARILPIVERFAGEVAIAGWGTAIEGAVSHFVGLANSTVGRHDAAAQSLRDAIRINNDCGWTLLRARSQLALAAVLSRADGGSCAADARIQASRGAEVYARLRVDPFQNPFIVGASDSDLADTLRRLASAEAAPSPTGPALNRPVLVSGDAETISLSYAGELVRIRMTKGARQLSWLLANPQTDIPATLLAQVDVSPDFVARTQYVPEVRPPGKMKVFDDEARGQYARRIRELRGLLDRDSDDPAAVAELREEMEWLNSTMAKATSPTGRLRFMTDNEERARVSVRNNLTNAIKKIHRQSPRLGTHLMNTVHTGALCAYRPESGSR